MPYNSMGYCMSIKVTYQLDKSVVENVKQAVNDGAARTMSEFVQLALEERLRSIRRDRIRESVRKATEDDLFREDVRDVNIAYASAVTDGLRDSEPS